MRRQILTIFFIIFLLNGCATHQSNINASEKIDNKNKMTVGIIQKDIKQGMNRSDVLLVLGSPNLVSNNLNKETWVYDKISTETYENKSDVNGGMMGIVPGFGAIASASSASNSSTTAQNTLTVILTFNENGILEKIAYHTSKF